MGLFTRKRNDLRTYPKLKLDWSATNAEASLSEVYDQAIRLANDAIEWYVAAKKAKKTGARSIRICSILLGALAAILPTIGEMFPIDDGKTSSIRAGWTTVFLGIAGTLLLLDRFFGYSSAWIRYIVAELQLRHIYQEFQMDWEAERSEWQGSTPTKEQVVQMLARCKTFISQVNTIVREETNVWVREFQDTIKHLDESVKAKSAITEPGALNLTVSNGEEATEGWTLIINDGKPEQYKGKSAGKRNIIPGKHEVKVIAMLRDRTVQAEKVVTIPAGGVCEETVTLT